MHTSHPRAPFTPSAAYTTIELFAASLGPKTKLRGLLEILSGASEFGDIPVRPGEEGLVQVGAQLGCAALSSAHR